MRQYRFYVVSKYNEREVFNTFAENDNAAFDFLIKYYGVGGCYVERMVITVDLPKLKGWKGEMNES